MLWTEWIYNGLVSVTSKALDNNLGKHINIFGKVVSVQLKSIHLPDIKLVLEKYKNKATEYEEILPYVNVRSIRFR